MFLTNTNVIRYVSLDKQLVNAIKTRPNYVTYNATNIVYITPSWLMLTGFQAKSLERSPAVGDFYGTRIEIWAEFGPVRQLLRPVFSCFHEQKKFLKKF
mgnify:CR=1 FL=1